MSGIREYYRSSGDYRTMLDAQDEAIFAPYVALFRAHAEPGMPVIDVGCGVGASTRLLRNAGFDAVGTDVSERFLPDGEEGFVVADFESAPQIPSGAYAAAGALNVIEHMEHPRRFLAEPDAGRSARRPRHPPLAEPDLATCRDPRAARPGHRRTGLSCRANRARGLGARRAEPRAVHPRSTGT
ncbi:MAG: methyltransferase domain-containing protein [Solirubrobacterales bacterium]|nr:methyltransferase domain-containing protein [Solirubrobacterales bacterium]